jgi:hypothetical protein
MAGSAALTTTFRKRSYFKANGCFIKLTGVYIVWQSFPFLNIPTERHYKAPGSANIFNTY